MNKRLFFLLGVLSVIVLMAGCGNKEEDEAEKPVPVSVAPVSLATIEMTVQYQGDIEAETEVMVFSKIPDRIMSFDKDDGDFVRAGETIARVYSKTIEQAVRQAEAGLSAARAQELNMRLEYERAKRLNDEGAMSQQQFESVETQYKAVQAQLEQAEAGLVSAKSSYGDATITAPISGIIGKRYMDTGDMASPGMPVVSVVQMDRVKLVFEAAEQDLGRLREGQEAEVSVRSYPDRTFSGKVTQISPVLDPVTRLATVEVLIDNPERLLKPGMFGKVSVVTGRIEDTIVIPRTAVTENTSLDRTGPEDRVVREFTVYVAEDSTAVRRRLEVPYADHVRVAVSKGLTVGEQLVVRGQNNLKDGSLIQVIEPDSAQAR